MKSCPFIVIGGAYIEECAFPHRQLFRGSGARAAAFLSNLGTPIVLKTPLGYGSKKTFYDIARRLGYSIESLGERQDIIFQYDYPLAAPKIYHHRSDILNYNNNILCESALVFGMLEGRPVVHAQRVVYDAQDGCRATAFESNGSSAEHIALILSFSEGKALSGKNVPEDIADQLLLSKNVETVVLKCGPQGALVKTQKTKAQWVYPFESNRVYKIGSGDIFSAAFAYAWLKKSISPIKAAWFASKCCSLYVETGIDKICPQSVSQCLDEAGPRSEEYLSPLTMPDEFIYLAGPFFSTAQRWIINDVRRAIMDMGFKVFSPIHDVGIGSQEHVATQDLTALDKAKVVLAILDGLDPGTIFELGYAKAKGKKIIAASESISGEALTMIVGSGCEVVNDLTTAIYKACWRVMEHA